MQADGGEHGQKTNVPTGHSRLRLRGDTDHRTVLHGSREGPSTRDGPGEQDRPERRGGHDERTVKTKKTPIRRVESTITGFWGGRRLF